MLPRESRHCAAMIALALVALAAIAGCLLLNSPPSASFSFTLSRPDAPCVAEFDGSASFDSDGAIVRFEWSFGDGSQDTGRTTTHTYSNGGSYTVTLEVEDDGGATSVVARTLLVQEPHDSGNEVQASFEASPRSYMVPPYTVQLDASSSSAPSVITAYNWQFGDSGTGTGRTVLHTYPGAGSYTVSLTVLDAQGGTDSISKVVTVSGSGVAEGNTPPSASFTATPTSGPAPLLVSFDASGSSDADGTIASYDWT